MTSYVVQFIQSIGVEAKDEEEAVEKAILIIADDPSLLTPESMSIETSEN